MDNLRARLFDLFGTAHQAHFKAYEAVDGADAEWPLWYADYLHQPLTALLGVSLTKSELVHLLVRADREHRRQAPDADWRGYYADLFLDELKRDDSPP
jgi:hypothetical protein